MSVVIKNKIWTIYSCNITEIPIDYIYVYKCRCISYQFEYSLLKREQQAGLLNVYLCNIFSSRTESMRILIYILNLSLIHIISLIYSAL